MILYRCFPTGYGGLFLKINKTYLQFDLKQNLIEVLLRIYQNFGNLRKPAIGSFHATDFLLYPEKSFAEKLRKVYRKAVVMEKTCRST